MKYAMIVYTREPAVENIIDFVVKFASSFETPVNDEEEENVEEEEDSFLNFLFTFLLEVCIMCVFCVEKISRWYVLDCPFNKV